MPRKKKQPTDFNTVIIGIAKNYLSGNFGSGISAKQKINALGYGDIYSSVIKYANMIKTGQL